MTTSRSVVRATSAIVRSRAMFVAKQVTATRWGQPDTISNRASRMSPSEPEMPFSNTLVESQIKAVSPASPSVAQRRLVGGRSDDGSRVELPVGSVQHHAAIRADCDRLRLGDGVGHSNELQVEWPNPQSAVLGKGDRPKLCKQGARRAFGGGLQGRRASRRRGSEAAARDTERRRDDLRAHVSAAVLPDARALIDDE